jgi:glycogen debranching enzyme GlgX
MNASTRILSDGLPWPLGAKLRANGVNFAIYAPEAEVVWCCLFSADGATALECLPLPACTNGIWHGHLSGVGAGLVYGLRTAGPLPKGQTLNPAKLLLDPWATELVGSFRWHPSHSSRNNHDNAAHMPKARVPSAHPPAPDTRPGHAWSDTVILELHVRGFSRSNPHIPSALQGTYAGLGHPASIEWLGRLGINCVELLPVQWAIDEAALVERGLSNYWGYNPLALAVPNPRYAAQAARANDEFRDMVQNLHAAGIEVILDVVFNHTAEGPAEGPVLSWRGLAPHSYYRHDAQGGLVNVSGCGNSLNLTHPRTLQLVLDSLRVWARDYGVDGFRFDLASALSRDHEHRFQPQAAFWCALLQDPTLGNLKLIAEPWDAAPDGHGLGHFPAGVREWNDNFRDNLRRFWLRKDIAVGSFAHSMAGSSGHFEAQCRDASHSINYITAHDGFTLNDLVSYRHRCNADNGENGQDGCGENWSDNSGHEGCSYNPVICEKRLQRQRALLACLLLARGVPMLRAGDERRQTLLGNNNAYCHDSSLNWLDWNTESELFPWIQALLELRRESPVLRGRHWLSHEETRWFSPGGQALSRQQWNLHGPGVLGFEWGKGRDRLCVLINAAHHAVQFARPPGHWLCRLDSATGASSQEAATHDKYWRLTAESLRVFQADPELAYKEV